jgi:hypothetical protein
MTQLEQAIENFRRCVFGECECSKKPQPQRVFSYVEATAEPEERATP